MIDRLFRFQASDNYNCYSVHYSWYKKRRVIGEFFRRAVRGCGRDGLRVLDVGCGDGFDLFMLLRLPDGKHCVRFTGVDLDAGNIAYCRARAEFEGDPRMEFAIRDVLADPLGPGQRFDIVICSEAVEHMTDPDRAIAGLAGLLPAGGWLILTTPNGSSYSGRIKRALRWVPSDEAEGGHTGHISVRGRRAWRLACAQAGLQLVAERRGSFIYGSPALDQRRWLAGFAIAADGILDVLHANNLSWETLQLYRREA